MKTPMTYAALIGAALMISAPAAFADMLTDADGMTLYTFDKDEGGVSTCYDQCAVNWPPYLGSADAKMSEGWTLVERTDGTMQWAYDGKPLYYYVGDAAKGDMTGDGRGGVWHVVME